MKFDIEAIEHLKTLLVDITVSHNQLNYHLGLLSGHGVDLKKEPDNPMAANVKEIFNRLDQSRQVAVKLMERFIGDWETPPTIEQPNFETERPIKHVDR